MDNPSRKGWQPRMESGVGAKYLRIVEALGADWRAGLIKPGDRLPSQRAVAKDLGVDLTTVTRAFNEAGARGLIDATTGRGSFVSMDAKAPSTNALLDFPAIDLSMNIPPQPEEAGLARRLPDAVADVLGRIGGMAHLHYQESGGSEPDRAAGALWLGRRIPALSPDRVLVAPGSQGALFALCQFLARPGDAIAAGVVTYPGIQAVATQLGLRLVGLAMDRDGILPEAFAEECALRKPAALYVIPAIDNPTTATLPEERRRQLVEIARGHGVPIIEDDPYSELVDDPPAPFAAIAPELTWHIATLSKIITPALRIAYVAAPGTAAAAGMSKNLRATVLMASPLMAAVASRWIGDGMILDIVAAIRGESRARQKIAATVLLDLEFEADPCGHHLWLPLPVHWRAVEFAYYAERSGLSIVPGSAFATVSPAPNTVRLSLGAAASRATLISALSRLRDILAQPPVSARALV